MDGQFDGIRGDLANLSITLNTVARGEHVPEIEHHIRTIKESVRCVYATLPFTKFPSRILVELVYFCEFWLNSFPAQAGISDTLSPRSIVHGSHIDFTSMPNLSLVYMCSHIWSTTIPWQPVLLPEPSLSNPPGTPKADIICTASALAGPQPQPPDILANAKRGD